MSINAENEQSREAKPPYRRPEFVEAAMEEMAQGAYAKNESIAFRELPEFLMDGAEWAWRAGYKCGRKDAESKGGDHA